ncbi:MAG TPA: DNA cytosine methyltransferase [Pyrinomonadaceae bacterium]|jgi:DNA (cytosine-5)-methyltransferase 1
MAMKRASNNSGAVLSTSATPDVATIPLLSFFTGAGLLDLGFLQAGFNNIVWRNEYEPNFVRGFEFATHAHLGKEHKVTNTGSIHDATPRKIKKEAFNNTGTPELFGIVGGTPCPDFAFGGNNKGEHGEHGKLSQVYVDRIIALQPTFFLLENVAGLSRTGKHQRFLKRLKAQLQEDYSISLRVLNALDFGAPQFRERVFIAGFSKRWLRRQFGFRFPQGYEDWFPWPKAKYPNAKGSYKWPGPSRFGGMPVKPKGIPDELMVGNYICDIEETSRLPNGMDGFRPKSKKFKTIREGDSSGKSFKRLHRWRYSPAAAYGNNEVHLHPVEPRRLTLREVLRIQTVPDTYVLPHDLTLTHKYKMVGNGVPVVLASAVASSFIKVLQGTFGVPSCPPPI